MRLRLCDPLAGRMRDASSILWAGSRYGRLISSRFDKSGKISREETTGIHIPRDRAFDVSARSAALSRNRRAHARVDTDIRSIYSGL